MTIPSQTDRRLTDPSAAQVGTSRNASAARDFATLNMHLNPEGEP